MPFTQKLISVSFTLVQGAPDQPRTFTNTNSNQVTLSNHRASVRINNDAISGTTAEVSVYGMNPLLMQQLSTLGTALQSVPGNSISVAAGDSASGLTTVFVGIIVEAWPDYNQAPNVPMVFQCNATGGLQVVPFAATSYSATTSAAVILSALAKRAGLGFDNSGGVTAMLPPTYLSGDLLTQVRKVCSDSRTAFAFVSGSGAVQSSGAVTGLPGAGQVLAICPIHGYRKLPGGVPLISPGPGQQIGYPTFSKGGIVVKTIFDTRLAVGGQFKLQTTALLPSGNLLPKDGIWTINKLDHALDTMFPKGQWMSTVQGWNVIFEQPPPGAAV